MNLRYAAALLAAGILGACRPEMPTTSTITIDLDRPTVAVDRDLYGVTSEAADGTVRPDEWSADMITNGSFEVDGPSATDSIAGWRALTTGSALTIDARAPLSETNRRSLLVRGGVVADVSRGAAAARGERFELTCYLHGTVGRSLTISLRDSLAGRMLAEPLRLTLPDAWTTLRHTFTATDSVCGATLVFETDSGASFGLDMVALFPQKTWRNRPMGLRTDLIEAITDLRPRFIRFSGRMMADDGSRRVTASEYTRLCQDLNIRPVMIKADESGPKYLMDADLMMTQSDLFTSDSVGRYSSSATYADAFGTSGTDDAGTMRAAVGEAAFLIGVERRPGCVRGLSYTPLIGTPSTGGLLLAGMGRLVRTPSYYVWQLFADHRGRRLLTTNVTTARKPLLTYGKASVAVVGDAFAVESADTLRGSSSRTYNGSLSARLMRKMNGASGSVRLRIHDNGRTGALRDAIVFELTDSTVCLIHESGTLDRVLAGPIEIMRSPGWMEAKVECADEAICGYINNVRVIEAAAPSRPSLVAVATSDPNSGTIILKVANTTQHDERTALRIEGGSIATSAHIVSLAAPPTARNTPLQPTAVMPVIRNVRLPRWPMVYVFPANSVTILTLKMQ